MNSKYIIDFLLPLIMAILTIEKISCSSNNKDDEINPKLFEIFKNSLNIEYQNNFNLKDILSKMTIGNNYFEEPTIKIGDEEFDEIIKEYFKDKNKECFEQFFLMGEEGNNINSRNIFEDEKKFKEFLEHCKDDVNKLYKIIIEKIVSKITKNDKLNIKFEFKDELNDINFINDKNNYMFDHHGDKKKNKSYDDELEQYYINSRKDCVEYGLKSPQEEIIVCTKYE